MNLESSLAIAILQLADDAGMPDTYWQTDSRVTLAREVLSIPEDGRYTHSERWDRVQISQIVDAYVNGEA